MPSIAADKIIGQDIYALGNVQALNKNFQPGRTFSKGQKIGTVYSYIENNDGDLFWMLYDTPNDFQNFNPIYVKHIKGLIDCPALPGIIAEIERKKQEQIIQEKGALRYYIEKYLPFIVAAVAIAIVVPALNKRK